MNFSIQEPSYSIQEMNFLIHEHRFLQTAMQQQQHAAILILLFWHFPKPQYIKEIQIHTLGRHQSKHQASR
jgi:hypothetical protein